MSAREELRARLTGPGGMFEIVGETVNLENARVRAESLFSVKASNLVGNALKFRQPQRPTIVTISADRRQGGWMFLVRDNGIGIDPKYFDRIFQMFQRLHGRGEHAGTGIGLALCKKIVERHGGHMSVASEPGLGTTFSFTIPDVAVPPAGGRP